MGSKKCAREDCGKAVYPIEELKCLDKVWHKQCFKCTVCGMALNMKNYKGYNKMPYCEPHYPKTVASVVADTPEMRRLAENTKIQSQIKYHEQFEKMRGQKIQIADDPEINRHLRNTQVQSQAAYHHEGDKKRQMDETRPAHEIKGSTGGGMRPQATNNVSPPAHESASSYSPVSPSSTQPQQAVGESPYSARAAGNGGANVIYSSEQGGRVATQQRPVGSIADYDPLNGNWGSIGQNKTATKIGTALNTPPSRGSQMSPKGGQQQTASAVKAPLSNGASDSSKSQPATGRATGFAVKALYDYTANDTDEVSFAEGDVIVNCQSVDEGWMTGTCQRTLQFGMLPANYVERIKIPTGQHYLN